MAKAKKRPGGTQTTATKRVPPKPKTPPATKSAPAARSAAAKPPVRASSDSKHAGKSTVHANQSSNGEKVNVKDGGAKGTAAKAPPKSATKAGKGAEATTKTPPPKGGA